MAGPTANGTYVYLNDASPAGGGRTLRLRPLVWYNDSNGAASYRNIPGSFTSAPSTDFSRPPFDFRSFFGDKEAQVVCRSLGYPGGGLAYDSALPNNATGLAGFLPYYYSCSTGLELDLGQCNATSLSSSSLLYSATVAAAGALCFPLWDATEYCYNFTSQLPSLLSDSTSSLQPNGTQAQQPPSYGSPSSRCSSLLSQAADVDTLAFQRFPGQPLPLEQALREPCFNATVMPALVGWMQRWLSAVQQDKCSLVPYVWMPYVSRNINRDRNSTCPVAMASWPTAASYSPTNSTNSTFTFMDLDSRMVPTLNSNNTSTSNNTSSGGGPTSTALNTTCAAHGASSTVQAMEPLWWAYGAHGGGPWTVLLSPGNLLSFRGNATAFAQALKSAAPTWVPGRLNGTSHVANVLAAFSRPGGLQFALNTTVDTASAAAFIASTPLLSSEVRQLLPPPPLQYVCLEYNASWLSSYGAQDRDVLAFLNSSSAASLSGSGGPPVWGRAADRQQLQRCAGTGQGVQALYSVVGFSMCSTGLTNLHPYARQFDQLLPSLFRGATNSSTNGNYSTSVPPYPGDPVIPAANLAFLDMSGNSLYGGMPLMPLPALLVNLSRTGLSGSLLGAALGATQPNSTSPFPSALVVDLSGNALYGPLTSGSARNSSWGALLETAVYIDLSDNQIAGPLPGDEWVAVLKEVDIRLAGNKGLSGTVPKSWLALSSQPGWGPSGRLLDFSRCSGLEQRFSSVPEYSLLRVSGTRLLLDWGALEAKDWGYVVGRVRRGHMEFQQVLYSRPRQASDVIPGMSGVLDSDDVAKICNCIDGTNCNVPVDGQAWPVVLDRGAVNKQYTTWQQDPSMWCEGGRAQRFRVAVRVWAPTLAVVLLALLAAVPLYNLQTRIARRRQARRAQRQLQQQQHYQQQQRRQQPLGHEEQKQEDGKPPAETATGGYLPGSSVPAAQPHHARYHAARCWSGTKAAAVATWHWLVIIYDLLEPRLVVVLYWVDLISDLVFVVGYKGWGKQPAPAIAVLIILLGNMVLFWVLHLLSERKNVGWSRRRCWCVGLLTAPFGIVLELLWHFLLAVVVVTTFPFAAWDRQRWGGLHAELLRRLTCSWPHLLRYEAHARSFEHSVLLEPVTESMPQLVVQTVCYVIGREAGLIILTPIFLFSATLSAISICKASLYLAWRVVLCGSWRKVLLNQDDMDSLFTPPLSTVLSKADADPGAKATASGGPGFPGGGQPPPPPPEGSPVHWGASGYQPTNVINKGCTANSEVSSGTRTSSGPSPTRSSSVGPHAAYPTTTAAAMSSPPGSPTPPRFYPHFAPRLDACLQQQQPPSAVAPAASGLYLAVSGYPPPHKSEGAAAPYSTAAGGPPQPPAAIPPWVGPLHQGLRAGPPPAPLQPPPLSSAPSFQKARILPRKQRPGQQPQGHASASVSLTPLLGLELADRAQSQQGVVQPPAAAMYPPPPTTLHGAAPPPPYQAPYGRDGYSTVQDLSSVAARTSGAAAVVAPHPYAPPPPAASGPRPATQREGPLFVQRPTEAPVSGDAPFMAQQQQQQQQSCPRSDGGVPQAMPGSGAGGLRPPPPPPPPAFLHDDE